MQCNANLTVIKYIETILKDLGFSVVLWLFESNAVVPSIRTRGNWTHKADIETD